LSESVDDIEISEEKLLEAYKKAFGNLVNYRAILLNTGDGEVEPATFHKTWSDSLLFGDGHEGIEAFRESAKTQYILRSFPLHSLTFPSKKFDYIVIIKNNATLAKNKLKEITDEYLTNPAISATLIKINVQSGDVFDVDVEDSEGNIVNVRIEAYGKGASIRGIAFQDRRPKIIIIDDPQDTEDAKSETVLESDWNWFLSDVMFLGQNSRIFLIGNNLGEKCIVERVFANKAELNFNTSRIPIESDEHIPTWPSKFSSEFIAKEKQSYLNLGKLDIWLRERMCRSVSEETQIFKSEYFPRYTPALARKLASEGNVTATLDPASSKEKTACFRAICVKVEMPDGHWYILEMPYGRWDSAELIDKIFEAVILWGIRDFGIEKGMLYQTIEPFIVKEMTRRNVRFNLIPLEHGKEGSKLERIKMLQPRAKIKSIWLPDHAYWLAELLLELAGVTKDAIKSAFIDLVDSLAMHEQMSQVPLSYVPMNRKKEAELPRKAVMR